MQNYQYKLTVPLTFTSIVIINCFAMVQPASAQLIELATGALSILNSVAGQSNSQMPATSPTPPVVMPQQIPQQPASSLGNGKYDVGTDNFNGNTINFCMSSCHPGASQSIPQQPTFPVVNSANSPSPAPVQSHPAPNQSQPHNSTNYLPIDFSQL